VKIDTSLPPGGPADRVAPELVRRYGDLFSRCSLSTPWDADAALVAEIADGVRKGATRAGRPA
jgi:hypothetical protein